MFMSAKRLQTATTTFRSFTTLQDKHEPFGSLYVLKDHTLAGEQSMKFIVEDDSQILLLPTIGTIVYQDTMKNETLIHSGQLQLHALQSGTEFMISNPYETQLVNFIQVWIKKPFRNLNRFSGFEFDIDKNRNKLLFLGSKGWESEPLQGFCIGKFNGRGEAIHKLRSPKNGLFVFVLEGAFEVQHRLLETHDALALWNVDEVEIEALSNNAILCMLELAL